MARKELDYVVAAEGRDKGKTFHLKEMSVIQAERWATRALQAAARAGVHIDDGMLAMGMQGVAIVGIKGLMVASSADTDPLMDEMLTCISVKPDPRNPQIIRPLFDDDIEELATLVTLRMEVIKLHTGFSMSVEDSKSTSETLKNTTSSNTPTSPAPSDQRFRRKQRAGGN